MRKYHCVLQCMLSSMCMLGSKFKIYIPRSIVKTEKELEDERLGKELDEYQEMRRKEREKQYKKR